MFKWADFILDRGGRFGSDLRGNVAVAFALTLVPLMIVVGMAIDFSRSQSSAEHVQFALDGAVLAAARALQDDAKDDVITAEAQTFFDASTAANKVSASCGKLSIKALRTEHAINGSVVCSQGTTLSGMIGLEKLDFKRVAETAYGVGKLDVVFMFDTSGSMGSENRMVDLKLAATDAVKSIFKSEVEDPDDVRIAISTYATAVNVGETYFEAVTNQEPNKWECTRWKTKWGVTSCQNWSQVSATCVTGRESTNKYTDAAPGSGSWIAYETMSCNSAGLTPLTNDESTLIWQIDHLPTDGSTAGHLGIVWSWYLISPEWASIWPSSSKPRGYQDPDTKKVAILMTDGEFNVDYMSGGDSFAHAKKYCDAMKAKGITIYTVAFKAPKDGQEILAYCATGDGNSFKASNGDELAIAYQSIATNISDLRISH